MFVSTTWIIIWTIAWFVVGGLVVLKRTMSMDDDAVCSFLEQVEEEAPGCIPLLVQAGIIEKGDEEEDDA